MTAPCPAASVQVLIGGRRMFGGTGASGAGRRRPVAAAHEVAAGLVHGFLAAMKTPPTSSQAET